MVMPTVCLTAMQWQDSGELGSDDLELLLCRICSQADNNTLNLLSLLNREATPLAA